MPPTPSKQKYSNRRMRGFERADGLLGKQIRKASENRGFAVSRLLTHWKEVAGEELAGSTRPVRVSYGKGGFGATLTLLVRGAEAPFIQAELPKLKDRVNAVYGYAAISKISLTQTAPTGFSEGQAEFRIEDTKHRRKEPQKAAIERANSAASGIKDEGLRLALSRMGSHILSKHSDDREA